MTCQVVSRPAAPLIGWGPYGKHSPTRYAIAYPNCGLDQDALSPYTAFEAPDPLYWVYITAWATPDDVRGQRDATGLRGWSA